MLRNVNLSGPAGRLEALLNEGSADARYAALVCHPHPLAGGTLHNKVVYHAMKALNASEFGLGWPVLRFNFRGTGLSDGEHDGKAEAEDVDAALRWLENEFRLPLVVVGFSFGAAMALLACCGDKADAEARKNVCALAALGLPTQADGREYRYGFLAQCSLPKLFLSGGSDEFAPVADLQRVAATTAEPKKLVLLPGADHFFAGQLEAMQNALASWLKEQVP
jgi:alpha/beta superfamily hydrolase